jgi:integrase
MASVDRPGYRFTFRPADVGHGYPVLVFDAHSRLHLALTFFARAATRRLSASSVRVYLYALLPFFSYLARSASPYDATSVWNAEPTSVRNAVADYIEDQLGCIIRRHRQGFELVTVTGRSRSNVGAFLAALKLFYDIMREIRCYPAENPLIDVTSRILDDNDDRDADEDPSPRMPEISGVESPRLRRRLTDSFFKLVGKNWIPQIIDDPTLPVSVLTGGRRLSGWGTREECVTRLLFETGGRIFEVTGLTLGDWAIRGLTREATAVSKGSHGRRVKFFRFSSETATLLRRYFDRDRRSHDRLGWTLADYLHGADDKQINLNEVPLFLSTRGTPLTAKSFRETYWRPACEAAGIDADPHQARHWYVTMAVRAIYESSSTESDIRRRIRELIEYMHWRGGEVTMAAYDHYFDAARHADIQDQLHEHLRVALEQGLKRRSSRTVPAQVSPAAPPIADPDMAFLRVLGGANA